MSDKPIPCEIRGSKWTCLFTSDNRTLGPSNVGRCIYDSQVIAIRKKLTGAEAIGTVIHEWLHAYFPDAREDVILQAETELLSLLDSLGMLADEWASDEI